MYRNINIKILAAVFTVLLAVVILTELIDLRRGGRTFRDDLVEVSVDEVSSIEIYPKISGGEKIRLVKENDVWNVESAGKIFGADPSTPGSLVEQLNKATPESVVAREEDRWVQFEVTDSTGTRVKLFNGEALLADLVIGKFSFSERRKMTSYVRLAGEKDVYGVDGALGMSFNRNMKSFRDKTVLNTSSDDWTKLSFDYPGDSSFVLQKTGNQWMMGEQPADSAAVVEYFRSIRTLSEGQFTENEPGKQPTHQLRIEGKNGMTRIEISGSLQGAEHFFIKSSENPLNLFDSPGLAEKLFVPRSRFAK